VFDTSDERTEAVHGREVLPIRSHPFGTLLRDERGAFWRVSDWPRRVLVTSEELTRLDASSAIPLSSVEATCLHPREDQRFFDNRDPGWRLTSFDDAIFYVHDAWQRRRGADEIIMATWHEDESLARDRSGEAVTLETWPIEREMPLQSGTLVQTERFLYYVDRDQELRPFTSLALARAAGYAPERALHLTDRQILPYGWLGRWVTPQVLARCPTEESDDVSPPLLPARLDEDMDLVSALWDCDDHNGLRSPFNEERCDGVDNDCDGPVDEDCHNP